MAVYPSQLARRRVLPDRRVVTIRPMRPQDGPALQRFLHELSEDARRKRFMQAWTAPDEELVRHCTALDYDRHMAFVCEFGSPGDEQIVGEARYLANPGERSCELGIVVADAWRHSGVAQLLMDALIRAAQARGYETMEGLVLSENKEMLDFVRALGFQAAAVPEDASSVRVVRKL